MPPPSSPPTRSCSRQPCRSSRPACGPETSSPSPVPTDITALICEALGEQATLVESEPRLGRCSARACRTPSPCAAATSSGPLPAGRGRLRVVAGIDFGAEPADWREGQRFESVYNRLMGDAPAAAICLYDRRRLPQQVVDSAAATHPFLVRLAAQVSAAFQDPASYVPAFPLPRESVEARGAGVHHRGRRQPVRPAPAARRRAGPPTCPDRDQREDLHLAVAEIAANAFRHGTRPGSAPGSGPTAGGSSARSPTAAPPGATSSPGSSPRTASTSRTAAWGCGWPASSGTTSMLPGPDGLTVRLSSRLR